MNKKLNEKSVKQAYNYRYKLKQLSPLNKLLEKKISNFRNTKELDKYIYQLEEKLFRERQKNLRTKNRKKYLKNEYEHYRLTAPTKAVKALEKLEKITSGKEKKKVTRKRQDTKRRNLKELKDSIKRNDWDVRFLSSEIEDYKKLQKDFNIQVKKDLKQLEKTDKRTFDFINGQVPEQLLNDNFQPQADDRYTRKDKSTYNDFFTKEDFNERKRFYEAYLKGATTITNQYDKQLEGFKEIFIPKGNDVTRYSDVSEQTKKGFLEVINDMDLPTFYSWYSNNKSSIKDYYRLGKSDSMTYSESDLDDELIELTEELKKYKDKSDKYYNK